LVQALFVALQQSRGRLLKLPLEALVSSCGHNQPANFATDALLQAFYADHFILPLPAGHRFPMAKYGRLRQRLEAERPDVRLSQALPASDGELALVHTPAYIQAVSNGTLSPAAQREIGFPWSPAMAERARRSVGATIQACRSAMAGDGLAANLAGGTHHAYADRGSGFCVFNDAAVATRLLQAEHARRHRATGPLRVAIVDLDVHQGNGTAHVFRGDQTVFTLSMHGARNFPFRKEPSDLDVELPDGSGDAVYLEALEHALDELDRCFEPGLLIYLAGADPHEGDRLGRLKLSFDGLEARDRRVMDWAWQRRIPLAMCMAGGYGTDMEATVQVQVNTYGVALDYHRRWSRQAAQGPVTGQADTHWHNAAP
jgi:acetoin utilization deacetylase AcuC-like enzyme